MLSVVFLASTFIPGFKLSHSQTLRPSLTQGSSARAANLVAYLDDANDYHVANAQSTWTETDNGMPITEPAQPYSSVHLHSFT